jgi:branched-chain amino acid transport system substrate-binding protein
VRPLLLTGVIAFAISVAGCGSDQSRGGLVSGDTLTIYSSLPLQGPHAEQSQSIINAEKLALKEAGGKAGEFKVNFAARDDSTAGDGRAPGWDPGKVADNATKATQDSRTIGYIGEFDSGATAVSVPATNEAGFVQISPAATAVGLTKLVPGADKGEPDKYYPTDVRNFARVVPADDVQGSAAAAWAKQLGPRKVFLVDDKSVEGQGLVEQFRAAAALRNLAIVGRKGMDPRADDYQDFCRQVAKANPDLVFFGGGVESNARTFWRDLSAALPRALLMGGSRLVAPAFYRGLRSAGERTFLVSATQDPSHLPTRGQRFLRDYRREFGERADPYGAYGYAAMSVLLDAIRRAGGSAGKRGKIVDEVFATSDFDSAIGKLSFDENGDTSLDRVAGYRIRNGRLELVRTLKGESRT